MKYKLVIVIGLLPLVLLTGSSLVRALSGTSSNAAGSGTQTDDTWAKQADDARQVVAASQPLLENLGIVLQDPYDEKLQAAPIPASAGKELAELLDAVATDWNGHSQSVDLIKACAKHLSDLQGQEDLPSADPMPDEWLKSPDDAKSILTDATAKAAKSLQSLKDLENDESYRNSGTSTPHVEAIRKVVARYKDELMSRTAEYKDAGLNLGHWKAAKEEYDSGKFAACRAYLDDHWKVKRPKAVDAMYASAEFGEKAAEHMQPATIAIQTIESTNLNSLIEEIESLVEKEFPYAPTESDKLLHGQYVAILTRLRARQQAFQLNDPVNLRSWAQSASALQKKFGNTEKAKEDLREIFRGKIQKWMTRRIREKRTAVDFQVLVTKNNKFLEGVFRLRGNSWAHWPNEKERLKDPKGGEPYPKVLFKPGAKPKDPPTLAVQKVYTERRADLLARFDSRAAWSAFLSEDCKVWQTELAKYDGEGGTVDISLDAEILVCQQLVDEWDVLTGIL